MIDKHITIISSLPPIIGLSPYTKGLVLELSKLVKIDFLGFNHIYPKFLYPGSINDESSTPLEESNNLKIRNTLNWFNPFGWIYEAFKIKTEIIHAQWWSYPLAPIYITILGINKLRGKKIILTIHNVIPHEKSFIKILFNKSVFFLGDEYIVHTQINKEQLSKYTKNKPIHVIPHGLIHAPLTGISKQEARATLNISDNDKILLCFGHIRDYKGLDTAIKALGKINDPSVKLMIAGKCWEDWSKYDDLIKKLLLEDRIILKLGFIKNDAIEPIFMASDLVLMPYKHFDAQSGVGALAIPFGIPMIVSKVGGLTDYVNNDLCIIEPGNAEELAKKIEEIFKNTHRYTMLKDDLKSIKEKLHWKTISKKTSLLYE